MFVFVETSNDLKMYSTTDIPTTHKSYSDQHITIGKNFLDTKFLQVLDYSKIKKYLYLLYSHMLIGLNMLCFLLFLCNFYLVCMIIVSKAVFNV